MGKLKKRSRSAKSRVNPLATKKEATQDDSLTKTKILPLMEQLKSLSPNDRSMALGTISVMSDDPRFRRLLLKEKLVQVVLERCITDPNTEIVVESFGLLRNLVIEEGYDVAVYLWRQNIWATIQTSLEKCAKGFEAYKSDPKKYGKVEQTSLFDLTENIIALITGLAGSSDDIFDQTMLKFGPIRQLIKSILQFAIDVDHSDLRVSVTLFNAILDLLYDFSTQSADFIDQLTTEWNLNLDILSKFVASVTRIDPLSRVYVQGIKLQVLEADRKNKSKDAAIATIITETINNVKDINIDSARQILCAEIDNTKTEEIKTDAKRRSTARSQFQAVQLAVEVITAAIEIVAFAAERGGKKHQHHDSLYQVLLTQVPEVLVALLQQVEFRSRALTALNNLSWLFVTVQYALEQWATVSPKIWDSVVGTLSTQSAAPLEVEEKISVFGTLWAILMVLGEEVPVQDEFIKQTITDYQTTLNTHTKDDDEAQQKEEYITRLVGFLGTLAKAQGHIERNNVIGTLFINTLNKLPAVPGRVVVEILDILYEIYGDGDLDYDTPVFVEQKFLNQLEQLSPKIKTAVKLIDKNVNPELKTKADEVFMNLGRFIQYKKSEKK